MPVGVVVEIPGGTQEQYESVFNQVHPDGKMPGGHLVHVAGPMEDGWMVMDVWESEEAFNDFFNSEPMQQAIETAGLEVPEPEIFPVHNLIQK